MAAARTSFVARGPESCRRRTARDSVSASQLSPSYELGREHGSGDFANGIYGIYRLVRVHFRDADRAALPEPSMHPVRSHQQFAPTALGALMDPAFLRRAWDDADLAQPPEVRPFQPAETWHLPASLYDACAHAWRAIRQR